jgi:dTDP-4-dehydrorhamnose reductase
MASGDRDIREATRNVADATAEVGGELIHVSSDMVLDGVAAPFGESAPPGPVHEYGRWKTEAEEYVRATHPRAAIIRASLLTSFDPPDPRTQWVLEGLGGEREVRLFNDEIRTPILIDDIARQIWEIARLEPARRASVWNLAAPESISRYALGLMIAAAWDLDARVLVPARSEEAPGRRPRDLRLLVDRADRELPTRPRPLSVEIQDARRRIRERARGSRSGV